ncbi:MAG: nickel pincer cofactor biosynthesis protein LarC [Gemmatimonadaceae bacterium]|nr:nickel pincer cofactor biosynthesis protein LarC [Gemmatimonadaceae bacterium]
MTQLPGSNPAPRIAVLDPFSGIAGDMFLGALVGLGLDRDWLRALPARLGLDDVRVDIREVLRGQLACWKVEFDIPPQPHGRHIRQIRELVAHAGVPDAVRAKANAAFTAIATAEAEIHGMSPDDVHLHEVGAVDAILDVVGSVWGLAELGIERVYCGALRTGDGTVRAAHGLLPVPAPATLKLLEGHLIRPGPDGAGELVTPTGAALVRVLSAGPPPAQYTPLASGLGAGTKDFPDRANALRIIVATVAVGQASGDAREEVVMLAADLDDGSPEYVAAVADGLRSDGALDVVQLSVMMKKGRAGIRLEVLCAEADAARLEHRLLQETTTLGVRRTAATRTVLPRTSEHVEVLGQPVSVKVATLPDGRRRAKPEFDDVQRAALATGRPAADIFDLARKAWERTCGAAGNSATGIVPDLPNDQETTPDA